MLAHTRATLARGPYILGERFSAADVLVGTTFALFLGSPLLPRTPDVEAYVERIVTRPAAVRAKGIAGE